MGYKKSFLFRTFLCLFLAFLVFFSSSSTAFALTDNQRLIYAQNNLIFYNPDENFSNSSCFAGLGSYDGIATAGLSDLQAAFVTHIMVSPLILVLSMVFLGKLSWHKESTNLALAPHRMLASAITFSALMP